MAATGLFGAGVKRLAQAMVVAGLLTLAACGQSASRLGQALPGQNALPAAGAGGGALPGAPGVAPPLSALPMTDAPPRTVSFTNLIYYAGNGIYSSSGGAVFSGDSISLLSTLTSLEYALYSFNPSGYQPQHLDIGIRPGTNSGAWVGVSDYANHKWKFYGPYSAPAAIDLPLGNYLSPLGSCYVVLIASGGASVTNDYIMLQYENAVDAQFSISGHIQDEHGAPLGGVQVSADPGFNQVTTDAAGDYFLVVAAAGDYTVTPSSFSGYSFVPVSSLVSVAGAETGTDFTASRVDVLGRVATSEGAGVPGVLLTLTPGGSTATTGADGSYIFPAVADGLTTVEPLLAGYTFEPAGHNFTVAGTDVAGQDFTATGGAPTYTIRGKIALADTTPVADVIVVLNPGFRIAKTDASGLYAFFGLGNASYTLDPVLGLYTFTPNTRNAIIDNANLNNEDFVATPPPPTYVVSGKVKHTVYNLGIPAVTLKLDATFGPYSFLAYSDNNGNFSFPAVLSGKYYLKGSRPGFSFINTAVYVTNADCTSDLNGTCPPVTWDSFIAAFVSDSCLQCHRPDAAVPVDPMLNTYTLAKTWGSASNARIQAGTMPPSGNLPELYKRLFKEWHDNGYPEN